MGRCSLKQLFFAVGLIAACGDVRVRPDGERSTETMKPVLRLVVLTDLDGYLEPCGCQSRPLGGLDRAATKLHELAKDGTPTLLLAAGNLFYGEPALAEATVDAAAARTQEQWQAETVARALAALGLSAALPGRADHRRGDQDLNALGQLSGGSLLCGARNEHSELEACTQSLLVERGGLRVGLWGLAAPEAQNEPRHDTQLIAAARQLTSALRERGATLVLGLFEGDARTARRVAGATPRLDFLVHGGADTALVQAPERIGDATLVRAGQRGQGLLTIDLLGIGVDKPLLDVSPWTQARERSSIGARVRELEQRIAAWRSEPGVDREQLQEQQDHLTALRQRLSELRGATRIPAHAGAFRAAFIELDQSVARDPSLHALLADLDARVNAFNRTALASVTPTPPAPGSATYVGSERCGSCHPTALAWWKKHPHGHAYETLERAEKQFSTRCVPCHVTGYARPGGATVVHNAGLTGVGCESCHGPGSLHTVNPSVDALHNVPRQVPEAVCRACHDAEHSDRFSYPAYRARLLVKGHGLVAAEGP